MEKEQEKIKELEEKLKQSRLNSCILEEENSLLRETVESLLGELENIRQEKINIERQKEEINKIMTGKIYKILKKLKNKTK